MPRGLKLQADHSQALPLLNIWTNDFLRNPVFCYWSVLHKRGPADTFELRSGYFPLLFSPSWRTWFLCGYKAEAGSDLHRESSHHFRMSWQHCRVSKISKSLMTLEATRLLGATVACEQWTSRLFSNLFILNILTYSLCLFAVSEQITTYILQLQLLHDL